MAEAGKLFTQIVALIIGGFVIGIGMWLGQEFCRIMFN
jgi:uncharacterized membrane protein YedE/YeeE